MQDSEVVKSQKKKAMKYSDEQLLSRVKGLSSFVKMPKYLLIGVRSKADLPDRYDDKIYLFIDSKFVLVSSCTTHAGEKSLLDVLGKKKNGTAVIKSDEIYYDVFEKSDGKSVRHHKDRMPCLRQVGKMLYYRDNNKDNKIDEVGPVYLANYSTNVHFNNYDLTSKVVKTLIGGWSEGCVVLNDGAKYNQLLNAIPLKQKVSFALLKEF